MFLYFQYVLKLHFFFFFFFLLILSLCAIYSAAKILEIKINSVTIVSFFICLFIKKNIKIYTSVSKQTRKENAHVEKSFAKYCITCMGQFGILLEQFKRTTKIHLQLLPPAVADGNI